MPSQFVDALARGGRREPARLEVTVLFSDIRGFSTIAERLTAREIGEIVGRHLGAMAEVISEHGGTIDKFQGDAVMAVFGARSLPRTMRSGRSGALAMQNRQRELNAQGWGCGRRRGARQVGIGLNTGVVMAGAVGGGGGSSTR